MARSCEVWGTERSGGSEKSAGGVRMCREDDPALPGGRNAVEKDD